jgi:hypothetical protein
VFALGVVAAGAVELAGADGWLACCACKVNVAIASKAGRKILVEEGPETRIKHHL